MSNKKDPMSDPEERQKKAEEALEALEEAIIHSPLNGGLQPKEEKKDGNKED